MTTFVAQERDRQVALRAAGMFPLAGAEPGRARGRAEPFYLPRGRWLEGIDKCQRRRAVAYFDRHGIAWHDMRHSLLSSPICCLNHLLPFVTEPAALARLLEPVLGNELEMLPIPGDGLPGEPWHIAFEYTGPPGQDLLGEGGGNGLTRGRYRTSIDAVVRYRIAGRIEVALIEWKYTERGGDDGATRDARRSGRLYRHALHGPDRLLRPGVAITFRDLLADPFYQFMRQQLLASAMEKAHVLGAEVVRVLHLSPRANAAFAGAVTPAFQAYGATATQAWANTLAEKDRFIAAATEDVFGPKAHPDAAALLGYARGRYAFTSDPAG